MIVNYHLWLKMSENESKVELGNKAEPTILNPTLIQLSYESNQ